MKPGQALPAELDSDSVVLLVVRSALAVFILPSSAAVALLALPVLCPGLVDRMLLSPQVQLHLSAK